MATKIDILMDVCVLTWLYDPPPNATPRNFNPEKEREAVRALARLVDPEVTFIFNERQYENHPNLAARRRLIRQDFPRCFSKQWFTANEFGQELKAVEEVLRSGGEAQDDPEILLLTTMFGPRHFPSRRHPVAIITLDSKFVRKVDYLRRLAGKHPMIDTLMKEKYPHFYRIAVELPSDLLRQLTSQGPAMSL